MRPGPEAARGGFTLLEVMVALVLTALVAVGARMILERMGDDADRITAASADGDRDANAERAVRALVARLEQSTPDEVRFRGGRDAARFTTWCDVAAGWQERCQASLGLVTLDGGSALVLTLSTGEVIPVRRAMPAARLRYLRDPGGGGSWSDAWDSDVTTPLAIGVFVEGEDVTILRIGERG
jgi:prepilin-type N-terminal cleavage/methylation domain-containing protein